MNENKEFTKENYVPGPGCDNPFEGGASSPEELEKLIEWWEGSSITKHPEKVVTYSIHKDELTQRKVKRKTDEF